MRLPGYNRGSPIAQRMPSDSISMTEPVACVNNLALLHRTVHGLLISELTEPVTAPVELINRIYPLRGWKLPLDFRDAMVQPWYRRTNGESTDSESRPGNL